MARRRALTHAIGSADPGSATATFASAHSSAAPPTLVIEEVERIWAAIDTQDDWQPLNDKIAAIRRLGQALGEPPARKN